MTILAGLLALLLWTTFSPWCFAKHICIPQMQYPEAITIPVLEEGLTFAHQADVEVKEKV